MKIRFLILGLFLFHLKTFAQKDIKTYRRAEKEKNNKSSSLFTIYSALSNYSLLGANSWRKVNKELLFKRRDSLISNSAFSKLIKQDIAFAVIGNQSPTPGLSLDLSEQTSFKITGLIPSKRKIVTLDLTASRAEDNVPLFDKGKFNAQISTSLSFHIIPAGQWRPFLNKPDITLGNKYSFRDEDFEMMTELVRADKEKFNNDLLDTVAVLGAYMKLIQPNGLQSVFLRDSHLEQEVIDQQKIVADAKNLFDQKERDKATGQEYLQARAAFNTAKRKLEKLQVEEKLINKKAFDAIIARYIYLTKDEVISTIMNGNRVDLFFDLVSTYFPLSGKFDTVVKQREAIEKLTQWKADKLLADMDDACQTYLHRIESKEDVEIKRSRPLWTRKQLNWFTITAKPIIYTLNSFSNDSLAKPKDVKSSSLSFFEFSVPFWYQFYDIREAGGNLWRIGATVNFGSNRKSFTEVKYITRDTLVYYPNNTVIAEEQTAGIFDNGTIRRNKIYVNYYAEFYRLPRKSFVPGYSARLSFARNAIFGSDTDRKLRFELGSVLNILTSEKDKTIFTIQPYVAISNLLYETVKDGDNVRKKEVGEKTSAGIRVGIPIRQQLVVGRHR
ncbi:hypothetical protein GCM10028805_24870 [Spirosoma harenae]